MFQRPISVAVALALAGAVLMSTLPVQASHPHAVDPASINPTQLALPASALPPGTTIDHAGVSDNADASGRTTPPDGHKSQIAAIHQNQYDVLGRITGYREDFHYQSNSVEIGVEYLASIFPSADKAKAALNDGIGPGTLIQLIGQALPQQCTVGDTCAAFYGQNPLNPADDAVFAAFTDGPILVETGSQIPVAAFQQHEADMAQALFVLLQAADSQVKQALNGTQTGPGTSTPTPTSTAAPTATATATIAPAPTTKPSTKKCKKGYKVVHGKCKKVVKCKKHKGKCKKP